MFWSKKKLRKKISRECWNLNYEFIVWLKQHLPVYVEEAGEIVDLEYHKFNYKGKEYTQLQLINRMIELVNYLTGNERYFDFDQVPVEKTEELLEIFTLTFPSLWW